MSLKASTWSISPMMSGFFNFLVYVYPKYKKWRADENQRISSQNKTGRSSSGFNTSFGNLNNISSSQAQSAHFSIDPGALENSSSIIRDIVIMEEEANGGSDCDIDDKACSKGHDHDDAEDKESIDINT